MLEVAADAEMSDARAGSAPETLLDTQLVGTMSAATLLGSTQGDAATHVSSGEASGAVPSRLSSLRASLLAAAPALAVATDGAWNTAAAGVALDIGSSLGGAGPGTPVGRRGLHADTDGDALNEQACAAIEAMMVDATQGGLARYE